MPNLTPAERESRRLSLLADPTLAKHGRTGTYGGWGCRCQECRDAWSQYSKEHRAGLRRGRRTSTPAEERFWGMVTKRDGCWGWSGAPTAKGYAMITGDDGKRALAHRYSYELHNGPIAPGLQIDHMCYTRTCVNPAHLRAVTQAANLQNRSGAQRTSRSGVRGVHLQRGKWRVQVTVEGVRHSAGPFATAEEAESAVVAMRRELMPDSLRDRVRDT